MHDFSTLKTTFSSSLEKHQTSNIKACKELKHAVINDRKLASQMFTLYEVIHIMYILHF